jgi:NADH:ubiquinone oxidoreductase subunit 3 (subunit A)
MARSFLKLRTTGDLVLMICIILILTLVVSTIVEIIDRNSPLRFCKEHGYNDIKNYKCITIEDNTVINQSSKFECGEVARGLRGRECWFENH